MDCLSKFINHSCDSNCRAEIWTVLGRERIRLVATKTICKDDPLEVDYRYPPLRDGGCQCGSDRCKYPSPKGLSPGGPNQP
ncbi:uncharacterized protein BCR38DRAFT_449237 [Pseudomassariella vexata]|uniref:SET domain-containing protein n=1 Tax=Pseudomassariella vexata TaxID=1141098 RepID=A0A1Y2DDX0_9PEZI|nr:uncharacterized protein BCR38DRAFT_449237 [Pseudomassariella vexata]ORY57483.1 hypothetical protein BCR38DRAFT_449237 [Pseudomassariella vexata]